MIEDCRSCGKQLCSFHFDCNGMRNNLAVALVTEHDHVLKLVPKDLLIEAPVVPNPVLAPEGESAPLCDPSRALVDSVPKLWRKADTTRLHSFPPFAIPKVSSIPAADRKRIVCDC